MNKYSDPEKKYNTPIYNHLREYAKQDMNVFHMPGHKLAKGMPQELAQDLLQLDVTEIEGTDNLHYPEGIIKQAEELAANAFGADKTFFLVNGSTCGIQAAIMSVCARGQKIIIGRDAHKSVVSGLILSGAEPIFVYPEYNYEFGITEAISAKSIEQSLCENPDAVAVLITRPNYYGICSDLEEIVSVVHFHNKLLIVDEAHGTHLIFSDKLPLSALQYGADICIQSAHKTLPAVTQGAYLHIKGDRVDLDRLKFNLTMLQTSSPSYIIMSYLDIARELMVTEGKAKLAELIKNIEWFKHEIESHNTYKVLSSSHICNSGTKASHDPTRLVINVSKLGISGYCAEKILREKFKTQVEMADYENLVLIATIADDHKSFSKLLEAMKGMAEMVSQADYAKNYQLQKNADTDYNEKSNHASNIFKTNSCTYNKINPKYSENSPHVGINSRESDNNAGETIKYRVYNSCQKNVSCSFSISPYEAYATQKEEVSLEESKGRICAGTITPYPPGIPILYPGEIIEQNQIQYITAIIEAGGKVNGISDNKSIQVVK